MIIGKQSSTVERGGDTTTERRFRIAATGKAFEILSSGIYSDSVTAIIRELGTNAADSHIAAGKKDLPFFVQLPNHMEPYFAVRDFGTGLDDKQVTSIYTTYFASDKTGSNDYTGCLGLGSKSPFAYTDQFQVTAVKDGVKRTYTAFKNEDGEPSITRMNEEVTDKPNGVEVKLGVKREHFDEFRTKAGEVYRWFSPRPDLPSFQIPANVYAIEGDGWALPQKIGYGSSNQTTIVLMGNVAYKVRVHDLGDSVEFNEVVKSMFDATPVIKVKIGDVDFAASREALKFTKRTVNTLTSSLTKVATAVRDEAHKQIAACATMWAARLKMREITSHRYIDTVLKDDPAKWNGKEVATEIHLSEFDRDNPAAQRKVFATAINFTAGERRRTIRVWDSDVAKIEVKPETVIMVDDLAKGGNARIKYWLQHYSPKSNVYLLKPLIKHTLGNGADGKPVSRSIEIPLQPFIDREELDPVIKKTSTLPVPFKEQRARSKSFAILKLKTNPSSLSRKESPWTEATIDFDAGGIYVQVDGHSWSAGDLAWQHHGSRLDEFLSDCRATLGLTNDDVVGVRKRSINKFQKSSKWKRLDQHVGEVFDSKKNLARIALEAAIWRSYLGEYDGRTSAETFAAFANSTVLPEGSPFTELVLKLSKFRNAYTRSDLQAYSALGARLKREQIVADEVVVNELHNLRKEVFKRYPLLELNLSSDRKVRPHYFDYIRLMDARPGDVATTEEEVVATTEE